MNRFCAILVVLLASGVMAEPPAGYYYAPSHSHSSKSIEYVEHHPGHQPSEGFDLDHNLLHKIEHILVQHENSGKKISVPSLAYGVPQDHYGPPKHWSPSSHVVGIDFGHLEQSIPVAYYVGKERYAQGWNTGSQGWNTGSQGWNTGSQGWNTGSKGWNSESQGWNTGSKGWNSGSQGWTGGSTIVIPSKPHYVSPPRVTYGAPSTGWSLTVPKPPAQYGVPRW